MFQMNFFLEDLQIFLQLSFSVSFQIVFPGHFGGRRRWDRGGGCPRGYAGVRKSVLLLSVMFYLKIKVLL